MRDKWKIKWYVKLLGCCKYSKRISTGKTNREREREIPV